MTKLDPTQPLGTSTNQNSSKILGLGNLSTDDTTSDDDSTESSDSTETAETLANTITATSDLLNKYGIRQEILTKNSKEDAYVTAARKLNDNCKPKEEIQTECLGDIMYKVGYGVHIYLPFLPTYEDCFMYIKEVSNEWNSNGKFTSVLTLTPSRIMDEQEWADDDINNNSSNGSEVASKIIELLKQQLGKPYVFGAKGPDKFDCSGLIYYCYNQFQDQLINGEAMGGDTYTQCEQGEPVDKNDTNSWQPADLLFFTGSDPKGDLPGHVGAYIGGGQMIHAPKTGDVVKIIEVSAMTDLVRVRRVVSEDTSVDDDSTYSGDLNSAASATSQSEFVKIVAPYAQQLYKQYHIFAGVIMANMIQESWTGNGFTKLAKSDFNFGGVKIANSSEESATDYYPPKSEGTTPYRKFNSVADYMKNWCIFMTSSPSAKIHGYKTKIADKDTPEEQMAGFANTPYCGDPSAKARALQQIYNDDNLAQYDK